MEPIRVVVHGAGGKVGQVLVGALYNEPDIQLVGAVEMKVSQDSLPLPDGSGKIPFSSDLDALLAKNPADVIVDFTIAKAVMPMVQVATRRGVNLVIGTTGLSTGELDEINRLALAHQVGAVVAPNFALGAVLMMHMAKIAARYFDYAEIIELHHHQKVDAPSGTALATAQAMAQAKGKTFNYSSKGGKLQESRGKLLEGIAIHSVRLPGLLAHQEVLLGGAGQTLSISHNTINRECYVPGVVLAIKEVVKHKGLVYGLDNLLGL